MLYNHTVGRCRESCVPSGAGKTCGSEVTGSLLDLYRTLDISLLLRGKQIIYNSICQIAIEFVMEILQKCNLTLAVSPTCSQHKPSAYLLAILSISCHLRIGRGLFQTPTYNTF